MEWEGAGKRAWPLLTCEMQDLDSPGESWGVPGQRGLGAQ